MYILMIVCISFRSQFFSNKMVHHPDDHTKKYSEILININYLLENYIIKINLILTRFFKNNTFIMDNYA